MKAARIPLCILVFLVSQEARALTPKFGHEPFEHVNDAGTFDDTCSSLNPYQLMAYLLAPTWPETTGNTIDLTPSPMTLSRNDTETNLYYQITIGQQYHRAFWHPGIGPWQIDDKGFASDLGMDRFDTFVSAARTATEMANIYCNCTTPSQCDMAVFSQWGCGVNGNVCETNFATVFNSKAPPVIAEDYSADSLGGTERRVCSIAGVSGMFSCFYVNYAQAEGSTSSWTGDPDGYSQSPLAQPFYVYDYASGGVGYEWRYWMAVDAGFPTDLRVGRVLGTNSRTRGNLVWNQFTAASGQGLCDHTKPHGDACLGQYQQDSVTPIVVGGSTAESTVKFRALMSDPSGQASSLEVELRQLYENGGNFYGTGTKFSPMIAAGNVAEATANGLVPGYYHWQARTVNASGVKSPWQSFGGNPDGATDFSVGQGGKLQVKVTVDGSPYSGPVSYSVSGPTSFVGANASTYPNLPAGGYTALYLSGGPANTSYSSIVPAVSQSLAIGGTSSWTLQLTTNRGSFCSANSGTNAQWAPSAICGGTLAVTLAGSGSGRVVSNPSGIDCSAGTCSTSFASGTQVALSANPGVGSIFAGWSGDASCGSGTVTVNANVACTATFSATSTSYTLSVTETGSGTVTSSDGGISCAGGTCTHSYLAGTTLTLTASAAAGWSFSSWLGACAGAGPVVQLVINGNMGCTANFTQNPQPTPVTTTGAATNVTATSATLNGTINPENFAATAYFEYGPDPYLGNATPGIPFGPGNNSFFPYAQTVTGLACATTYRFRAVGVGAGGDYIASNNTFTTAQCPLATCYALNLIANGDAPAPVPSPANASGCPNGQYHAGDHIALTVPLVAGDVVTGWGGTDNDTSTATTNSVTMNFPYNRAVYVIEQHICYHLTLGFTGQGSAPVATNPVAYCPPGYFPWGYEVDASGATPATGWQIGGWSGTEYNYSQLDHNYILMPQQSSTALVQFIPIQYPLTVGKYGNGSGTVTSDVPGIDCGATCAASYPYGTTVTLTATPDAGSIFAGWGGGACNGGVATVTAYTVCSATFVPGPNTATSFYTLPPCRVLDTRDPNDPNYPAITAGEQRVPVLSGHCGIPVGATAVSLNVTIVNPSTGGFVTLAPTVSLPAKTSTINFRQGQVRANNAVVQLTSEGTLTVYCGMPAGAAVDYLIDVNGYFAPAPPAATAITFAPRLDITVGNEPLGLAIADFDGDGKADVAVGLYDNGTGNTVRILRNVGSPGTLQFASPFDLTTGNGPERMAAGDLDNDGKPDLVVANPGNSTITIFRNVSTPGSLAFTTVQTIYFPTPHQVVIADFDGDGKPDLIVTSNSGRLVSVFHHASDPSTIAFDSRTDFSLESYPNQLAVADIDGDGKPDILVPMQNTSNLWIFRNTSSPGVVAAQTASPFATGAAPEGIAVSDLNADGKLDILVPSVTTSSVGVYTNASSSGGPFSLARNDWLVSTGPVAVAVGDLNLDGRKDVVVANYGANSITVLRNISSSGVIDLTAEPDLATPSGPSNVVVGDLDGDGLPDIVVANQNAQNISIFLNTTGHP